MSLSKFVQFSTLATAGILLAISPTAFSAVSTADAVLQYDSGTSPPTSYWGQPYDQSSAALGLPDPALNLAENDAAGIYPDHSFITPFNADYNPASIVALTGAGGYMELHMSQPISTAGFTLGVHTGSGLYDNSGNGDNSDPALTYTNPRSATTLVSADGKTWVSLGSITFDNPTNIYTDISSPYASTPGTHLANFGQPFLGTITSFDGQNFAQTLATLNGSAGGTWLDLSQTGLNDVDYVAFQTSPGQTMYLDSVVGIPVPEPTSLAMAGFGLLIILRRTR